MKTSTPMRPSSRWCAPATLARWATAALFALTMACRGPTAVSRGAPFRLEVAYSFPSLAASDFITAFDFDAEGTLWVVSFEGAIIRVKNGQASRFEAASVLGAVRVEDLFIDKAGRPWVAGGGSASVFDGEVWSRQGPTDYMGLSPRVAQVAVNVEGDVLLAVGNADAGGLLLRRGEQWQAITPANSPLSSPLVHDIEVAPDGTFWVASGQFQGNGGLSHLVDGQVTDVFDRARTGLLYNDVDDIAIAPGGIWLGFAVNIYDKPGFPDGGIQQLPLGAGPPAAWYPFQTGLSSNRVRSLVWSAAGELWFTTGLDEDPACRTCVVSIGVMDATGRFHILSHLNSDIAPNEYLPTIREGPGGTIYVARAEQKQISKVVR
jgi:hypothetical protein